MRNFEESGDCARAASAIEDFGDGRVGRLRWMLLRRHVQECDECGGYLKRMSAVVEALAGLEGVEAPDEFAGAVMSRLSALASGAGEPAGEKRVRHGLVWLAAAGLGLAMAVALAAVRRGPGREAHDKLAGAGTA